MHAYLGWAGAILFAFSAVPQVITTVREGEAKHLSLGFLLIWLFVRYPLPQQHHARRDARVDLVARQLPAVDILCNGALAFQNFPKATSQAVTKRVPTPCSQRPRSIAALSLRSNVFGHGTGLPEKREALTRFAAGLHFGEYSGLARFYKVLGETNPDYDCRLPEAAA